MILVLLFILSVSLCVLFANLATKKKSSEGLGWLAALTGLAAVVFFSAMLYYTMEIYRVYEDMLARRASVQSYKEVAAKLNDLAVVEFSVENKITPIKAVTQTTLVPAEGLANLSQSQVASKAIAEYRDLVMGYNRDLARLRLWRSTVWLNWLMFWIKEKNFGDYMDVELNFGGKNERM